jgi:hypothetical protein
MVFDATTGVLTGFLRSRSSINYRSDFTSYTAAEYMETMACGSPMACDPLDSKAAWVPFPGMPTTGFPSAGAHEVPCGQALIIEGKPVRRVAWPTTRASGREFSIRPTWEPGRAAEPTGWHSTSGSGRGPIACL